MCIKTPLTFVQADHLFILIILFCADFFVLITRILFCADYTQAGWHWNALQSPPALHFCFTPNHVGDGGKNDVVVKLLDGMRSAVATLMDDPDAVKGGSAPM